MLITIVATFYNSERYIPQLLRSVFVQRYTDWELLCVVDASPGHDAEIIESVTRQYGMQDRVRVIVNPENIGLSRSKKVGIDNARGDYVTFADGDDFFDPMGLQWMATPAVEYNVDLVIMNYCRYYAPIRKRVDIRVPLPPEDYNRVIRGDEFFDRFFINFFGDFFINFAYWAKLYRRELIANLDFEYPAADDTVSEDKWFNMTVFQYVRSAVFVEGVGYFWRWGGISSVRVDQSWSVTRELDKHIEYYPKQCALIEKYGYNKASLPLLNVLLNMFIHTVSTMAAYRPSSSKTAECRAYIAKCIDTEPIKQVSMLRPVAREYQLPVITAIEDRDIDKIYDIMHRIYRHNWKLRWVRRMLYYVMYPFR